MKVVRLEAVTKAYGERTILQDVSFAINEGELVALVGPSGCGKSTILNMIGLLETIDKGKIYLFDKPLPKITSQKSVKLRREVLNYLFQSYALINDMTVWQNLMLALNFAPGSYEEKRSKIKNGLGEVQLCHLENAVINTLSGGEKQRVALVRTLVKPGNLILADEPTGSLDGVAAELAFSLILRLCRQYGKTVIMVTHDKGIADQADRIIDLTEF